MTEHEHPTHPPSAGTRAEDDVARKAYASAHEEGGKTVLATLKPTTLLKMFNPPQLAGVAQEVEDTMVKIMSEAASGSWAGRWDRR